MTPLFCSVLEIGGVSPLRALDRLAKGGVPVYDVQKVSPTCLKIRIKSKDRKKIFAIFRGSCYTVKKERAARLSRLPAAVRRRPGFAAGLVLFLLLAAACNRFVLRIDVQGSGAYLRDRAVQLLADAGVRAFAPYGEENAEAARSALLTLPGVVFASVEKNGCCVTVTLEQIEDAPAPAYERSLYSPAAGVVETLTVLRGTALVAEGDAVGTGQELVGGWFETEGGERRETFASARCSLLCTRVYEYAFAERSEESERRALAAARLSSGGEAVAQKISARGSGGETIYTVELTVRVRCSVNL